MISFLEFWKKNNYFNERRVRILKTENAGREGNIISEPRDSQIDKINVVRIAFDEFWVRPENKTSEEANDNGYFFDDEWGFI